MGNYQTFRGNPENKLFYLLDGLVGGLNTEFSDDASSDSDFNTLVNFNTDKMGTLEKRNGFGKLTGISAIFNNFLASESDKLPSVFNRTDNDKEPELTNDNIVYMKLLRDDNNCFRNLAGFDGPFAYRDYQKTYGFQNNQFHLLILTVKNNETTSWIYKCTLPEYIEGGEETLTITCDKTILPVTMNYNKNLMNVETIEFFDKIYFTGNNKGLICLDRTDEAYTYTYSGFSEDGVIENSAYKPTALEISKVGFNVLGDNPLKYINLQNISTDSIQGIYLTTTDEKPVLKIPTGPKFLLNILYTGSDSGFTVTLSEGGNILSHTSEERTDISGNGLKCYEITFTSNPTTEVEIKIEKTGATIEAFYDYYEIEQVSPEALNVEQLNIGDCGIIEMYNRAVYYKNDTIWFSDVNNFSYIPNYNYITLPIEPTDKITKICYFKNIYIVFTKQRIYRLVGSFGSSDFALQPVNMSLGCHAGNTVVPIENMLYFMSPRGLYALKSSEFREGFENLVELDIKVKKLTSDFTQYSDELSNPVTRYGGVKENAYAVRYRDKYLLFYNSAYEKIDYAAENNLDVLVYDYGMKSFTTYSFVEKPTFLFNYAGVLLTYCATLQDGEVTIPEDEIINYDFINQASGNTIVDTSGNENDGTIIGDVITNQKSYALSDFDYIETDDTNVSLIEDIDLKIDAKFSYENEDNTIFETTGTGLGASISGYSGEVRSEIVNGYEAVFTYTIDSVNPNSGTITGDMSLVLNRTSSDALANIGGTISLSELKNNELMQLFTSDENGVMSKPFDNIEFSANFEDSLSVELYSGPFLQANTIPTDTSYFSSLKLDLDLISYDIYRYYEKGNNVSGTFYNRVDELSWIGIGVPYSVVAYDGYSRFTVTKPYIKHNGRLNVPSRALTISVAGKSMSFTIPKIVGDSGTIYSTETKYVDVTYPDSVLTGNGDYTVTVKNSYYIYSTLSGSYRESLNNSFSVKLPNIKLKEGFNTIESLFELIGTFELIYNPPVSNASIKMKFNVESEYVEPNLYLEISDDSSAFSLLIPESSVDFKFNERHTYRVKYQNNALELYCDDENIGALFNLPENYLDKRTWNKVLFGTDKDKTNYLNWEIFLLDFGNFAYSGSEFVDNGESTRTLIDISGKGHNGIMYGGSIVEYEGASFSGLDSYIDIPDLREYIDNGIVIELEVELKENNKQYNLFEFSGTYPGITTKLSVLNAILTFASSTNVGTYKTASISSPNPLSLSERHLIKIKCEPDKNNDNSSILSMYIDSETPTIVKKFNFNPLLSVERTENYLGKSTNIDDGLFNGIYYSFKLSKLAYNTEYYDYGTFYEFDTAYSDFGKPIYFELTTKGLNLQYPQHLKKLKHIFVKLKGGYSYDDVVFELYNDGYLTNDPNKYYCYVDDTGKVVYDYTTEHNLTIDERVSILGSMILGDTRLGQGQYQTKKLVLPAKGKNFKIKLYGKNKDYMSLESFGFVSKLGKVKQD